MYLVFSQTFHHHLSYLDATDWISSPCRCKQLRCSVLSFFPLCTVCTPPFRLTASFRLNWRTASRARRAPILARAVAAAAWYEMQTCNVAVSGGYINMLYLASLGEEGGLPMISEDLLKLQPSRSTVVEVEFCDLSILLPCKSKLVGFMFYLNLNVYLPSSCSINTFRARTCRSKLSMDPSCP